MKHYKIRVKGRVQGVWFRQNTLEKAKELGLAGIVENLADGTVRIEAEGDEESLQKLMDWCREGPRHAKVEDITYTEGEPQNYQGFSIS